MHKDDSDQSKKPYKDKIQFALASVPSAKYLGVTITDDLRWDTHIQNICDKANRTIGFLRRNLNIGAVSIKQQAYFILVRPLNRMGPIHTSQHTKARDGPTASSKVKRRAEKGDIWVLGDLNYPKLDWDKDDVPYIKTGCAHTRLYDGFIETMSDFNLSQMVRDPTIQGNILDLFLTSYQVCLIITLLSA